MQGLKDIDWEIHQVAHTRYQTGLNEKRATMLLDTSLGKQVKFECSKADVANMLSKINSCLA